MEDKIKDINSISNEDLLTIYSKVVEHLDYLSKQIIVEKEEVENPEGEENSEKDEQDGGDKNE